MFSKLLNRLHLISRVFESQYSKSNHNLYLNFCLSPISACIQLLHHQLTLVFSQLITVIYILPCKYAQDNYIITPIALTCKQGEWLPSGSRYPFMSLCLSDRWPTRSSSQLVVDPEEDADDEPPTTVTLMYVSVRVTAALCVYKSMWMCAGVYRCVWG